MGDSKLCLLLLLSTSALAFVQDEDQPACLLAKRYKTLHKYEYQYQAESLNAINGASPLKNGPKASCTVELEVSQTCRFTLRTSGCSLSEVVDADAEGNPVFEPAPTSDAFAAEMEKFPLRFAVEGVHDVKLYPADGETTTTLNFKRGIISALAVPLLEEDKNRNMPTIHGKCKTYYRVNAREDIATDVSLNRDLSECDGFVPIRDHTSPLALISGLHYPLAELFSSSQTCNYKFDNEKKHMTAGYCSEKHVLIPFSHNGEYGVTNVGNQELTLVQVSSHNGRVFEHGDIVKGLPMEAVADKSAVQDKGSFLKLLSELADLSENEGQRRAPLFHKLVTMVRGMKTETLSPAIPEALAVSRALTYQVLAQCGTPECSSAIMQILRTFDKFSYKIDAAAFALGLISNPSALLINDMLEMAKYKPSKPIMYALSNIVKRFYKAEGKLIPEIRSVAEFMASQLGDCSGSDVNTFMTLRVVGNMAPAVIPASPALKSAVTQCVNQPAASLAVQQAAIQVYRLIPVPEEDREILMGVLLNSASPMQKRVAAYLVLMKDPTPSELVQLTDALSSEPDIQVKSFVMSHINNILTSTEPETQALRQRTHEALQGNEIGPIMDRTKFSNNYKIGSVEGNMLFEGTSFLPKEVMLEMTLKAFGYDIDMMEIGMEGKGFEPTVDALFGENGFFPDTALKTMYFVSENVPLSVTEVLQNVLPALKKDSMKRQASTNLIEEIGNNLNKLVKELEASESPEAMVYLRLLGNELGYLRTSEVGGVAYSAAKTIENVFKMFSTDLMTALITTNDNSIFGHYIFMDTEFFLPTVTGVPLKIALSGTFTPGIKGGLKIARDASEVTFMPSVGIEFVTHIGSHIPEYVNSGLEMHTNIFHESGLNAKISVSRDQVKLTIPAPTSSTKLIKIANTLVAVTRSDVKPIPPAVTDTFNVGRCMWAFAGMKYCSARSYTDASSRETSPYFPFTGDSTFDIELQPTGEVTEYTATVAYELIREGEQGRQKVDSVRFLLRAEGAEPTEARAVLKYNRRKNVITADIQIPDYDVEAGIRLGVADGNTKGKGTHSIYLDFLNKNIPQLSLVGRANLKATKEGMLQGQLIIPSKNVEATVTANMKHDGRLELKLKSEIKLMDATSEQKVTLLYGGEKIALEFKSDVNTKTTNLPGSEVFANYGNEILDTQVGQTDMKVRHIFKKFTEAANDYVEKYGANIPYIQNFRVPEIPEISLPETLFLTTEAKAAYHFNNEHFTVAIPLPFGGMSTEDLNFPLTLTTPSMSSPHLGLESVSGEIPIPERAVPESLTMSIALFRKAEVSALVRSNLYNMEASVAVEKDAPSYSAKLNVEGTSPFDLLSLKIDGLGTVAFTDSVKASLKSSLVHKFIEASLSIDEDATITDKINLRSSSKIEAMTPFGVSVKIGHIGMTGINTQEITADNNFEGMFNVGPMYAKTISTQSFAIFPFRPEAKIDSTLTFDSTIVKAHNAISASLANGELSVVSNTKAFEEILTHVAELSFKDRKLSLKCDTDALILGVKVQRHTKASAGASEVALRMETSVEHSEDRVYSLLTASLDDNGLAVNSNAILKLLDNEATHKSTLKINKGGLTTSGTTSLQSPLSLENTFYAGVDFSKATLSITNKAALSDISVNDASTLVITLSTLDFNSKAHTTASDYASYTHDITVNLKPFSASANVNNNLNLLAATFNNEAKLKAELYNIDVTGSLKATYGPEEIKHTYEVKYADMTANAKFSTTGKVFGTHMNHNTELEVVGLAATITNVVRFNSQPLRFDHSIRCSIVPFDISFDALFNADGDISMYGKHSAQLYGKHLLKAQPLSFFTMHECRASITNTLDDDFSLESTFDNNLSILLSLQEQRTSLKTTSKMNEHAFNQGISIYNTAERTGIEVSGRIFTNILNAESPENQEFTASAFLKYDKNTDSRVIQLPLIENLPVLLESIKDCVVHIAETLQNYICSYEFNAALDELSEDIIYLSYYLDIEDFLIQLQGYFSDFMERSLFLEDSETVLRTLRETVDNLVFNLGSFTVLLIGGIDEIMPIYAPIDMALQQLNTLDKEYQIREFIIEKIDLISPCVEEMFKLIPQDIIMDPEKYVIEDLDLVSTINILHAKIKELIVKFEADIVIQAALEKFVEFLKQLNIEKTIRAVVQTVKNADIWTQLEQNLNSTINYLKSTDVTNIIEQLNMFIETVARKLNSLNYNDFVAYTNDVIAELTAYLNELIRTLEIPQKLEATIDFVNFVLSTVRGSMEHLREIKISETIKLVQDIIDKGVVDNVKGSATFIKEKITNLNLSEEITIYLNIVRKCSIGVMTIVSDSFMNIVQTIKLVAPDLIIISKIQRIIDGLSKELKKTELIVPSFPIPLTDLVMPSIVFRMDDLEIPTELDIPEFTILDTYTVKATTLSIDDIKQRIIELIDLIVNLDIKLLDVDAVFGDLRMNYFPSIPEITFPEITVPEISFPTIPKFPVEKLVKSLQVPEIKLPTIPNEIIVPSFGKLYGEVKFLTPIYTLKMSGEFQNSTENKMTPQFTGSFNSQATSPHLEILNYELNSTTRITIPKMSRVVLAETVKFNHLALEIDHQASVSLYGRSAQSQAKTAVKVKTTPYTANIVNTAFIAMGGGMSASVNTIYKHLVDLPSINMRSEAAMTQKSVARQDGLTLSLTVDNSGEGKINDDGGNHKSNLQLSLTPSTIKLTFFGDTDSAILKMKQQITAEAGILSYFKFNVRNEAAVPVIKNSLLVASGHGNLYDMKVELKANHDAELNGEISGVVSNALILVARPFEFVYEFQNKGNVLVNIFKSLSAKIDLQNDYAVVLRPDSQQISTVALARLNQYKMFYNFTLDNNGNEAGVFAAMESAADLEFLTYPISIPEIYIELPFVILQSEALVNVNLYEATGLNLIFASTEQTVEVDAKIVYKKGQPFVEIMGLIEIPYMGNTIAELIFKSSIVNLNANAGLYAEDNLVFRLEATTASVFESLNAKLHGTTSLTTKRGIKLANSLSLENAHIEGSHDSTVSTSTETLEITVSVATAAKIALPMFNLETKQNFAANTKSKANIISTLTVKCDFNLPVIEVVGKAETDHNIKLEGTFDYISMESTTRANMDGTIYTSYLVLGVLDNDVNVYVNNDGLRSTSKVIADAKFNHGTTRIIGMDVNENLAIEASLSHVYAVLKYTGHNEAKLMHFNTSGTHIVQATIDLAPASSLAADIEIGIFQPSNLGDLTISEKTVAEVTVHKQKISTTAKFSIPLYTTDLVAVFEGQGSVFAVSFKSSGTFDNRLLDYDINTSTNANFENKALAMLSKVDVTVAEITMDVNHAITKSLRHIKFSISSEKVTFSSSVSHHTLKVHITSPTVIYANLFYEAGRDGISASVSAPNAGFLGFQVNGTSQMSARVYSRCPSATEADVDILVLKLSATDTDEMNLQIAYNMETHKVLLSPLVSLISAITAYADELLTELATQSAAALDRTFSSIFAETEVYYTSFVDLLAGIEIQTPDGDVVTGDKIWKEVEIAVKETCGALMETVKNMDNMLAAVENFPDFFDTIKSDSLDAVIMEISDLYDNLATGIMNSFDLIITLYEEQLNMAYRYLVDVVLYVLEQYDMISENVFEYLRQLSQDAKAYIDVSEDRLEINLTFPFQQ